MSDDQHEEDETEGAPTRVVDVFEDEEFTQRILKLGAKQAIALGIDGTYRRGQKLVVIGTFTIDEIAHKDVGKEPTRVEGGTATELYVVSESTDALDVLQKARKEREQALDDLLGRQRLPLDENPDGDQPDNVTPIREPGSSSELTGMTDEEFEASLQNMIDDDSIGEGEFQDNVDDLVDPPKDDEGNDGD